MAEAERKGIDLTDTTPDAQGETAMTRFMKNKEIISNPIAIGEKPAPKRVTDEITDFLTQKDPTGELRAEAIQKERAAELRRRERNPLRTLNYEGIQRLGIPGEQ